MQEPAAPTVEPAPCGFDETAYRAWNPDVDAAIHAGELTSAQAHFETFGRHERRAPYFVPGSSCAAPALRRGDVLIQPIRTWQDWWAAAGFGVATHGGLARVVLDCAVLQGEARETVRTFRFDEWAADGERLVMKFPPVAESRDVLLALRIEVVAIEAPRPVQLLCEPAQDDGLEWNGATPAAVRGKLELLYTPLTLPGPQGITLNPMTHCESQCIHCLSRTHHQRPGSLKKEWIEILRAHFSDGPGAAWCIDYATDFFNVERWRPELIDLLAQKGAVSVNTDGQYVTEESLRRILAVDLIRIGFSCDAATQETYAFVRKGLGQLENVFAAARLAVKLRAETGGQPNQPCLALSMVVMQANVLEMVRLVEIAAEIGVDAVWYNQLWVCEPAVVNQSLMFTPEVWRTQWELALQRGRELGVGVFAGADLRPEHPQKGITWCPEPWSAMVVLGNGDVLACASPASKIGSLRESTIEEIWNGPAYQELRRRANSEQPPLICEHCFIYRKPGNAEGVFMHHLTEDYDLRRDLSEPDYAAEFRKRFSFARATAARQAGAPIEKTTAPGR